MDVVVKEASVSGVKIWAAAGFTDTELRCFDEAGGGEWGRRDGRSAGSLSSRLRGWCGIEE
jgi:hypothetical protein